MPYNKTALKKMKKDDLVQLVLDIQKNEATAAVLASPTEEQLKEELEQYQMSHPCDLKCEKCGLTTTEDDLEISLGCGCLICESCQDEANLPDLKKQITELEDRNDELEDA